MHAPGRDPALTQQGGTAPSDLRRRCRRRGRRAEAQTWQPPYVSISPNYLNYSGRRDKSSISAVLGALALGDIGTWFPDTDPRWKGADSAQLLRQVLDDPRLNGWQLGNLDSTVITEKPKLAPYKLQIRQSIADIFNCPVEKISLKAKTNERQDAIGQGLALAAHAIVLMQRER